MKKKLFFIFMVCLVGTVLLIHCAQTTVSSAKIYMDQKEYDQAIEQCKIAIEQKPNNTEAYYIMGQAYGFKQKYHEMNEAFIKSLEFSNKYASQIEKQRVECWTSLINSGVMALRQNQVNEAIEQFQLAIELLPDRTAPYKNLAIAYMQNQNDSLAIETYLKVLEIDSTELEIKGNLGILYLRSQDFEKAITYLEEVVAKSDPTSTAYSQAVSYLAICYDTTNQPDKALETYKAALAVSPSDKDLLYNLGRLYLYQEKYEEAVGYFLKVIEQAPDDVDAHINVGQGYIRIEKFSESIPYLEKAVELDPNSVNAWNLLGIAYIRIGQEEKGNAAFKKVEELSNIP